MTISVRRMPIIFFLFIFGTSFNLVSQEQLSEHLEPLLPFVGKIWKAKVSENMEKKPVYDISKWERILNGKGVRILHSVNDGDYGGETIIIWDKKKESLVFYYFTTAGFYTEGTITLKDGKMKSHEKVSGNENGITEVEAISEITPEGQMRVKTWFKQKGEWTEKSTVFYIEDPTAEVIFR